MAAHIARSHGSPLPARRLRIPLPGPRARLALCVALVVLAVVAMPEQVAAAVHATCTAGNPPGTSCGEALVRLGFP